MTADWTQLAKTEIHLHLEGAAPPAFIKTLAGEQGLTLEGVFDEAGHYRWQDFTDFLDVYQRATSVLTTADHYRRLVEVVLRQSAADGVVYTEFFVTPQIAGRSDAVAWAEHLAAMEEGADAVDGIDARFISITIRNMGPDEAVKAAQLTVAHPSRRLTGFGMAGDERHLGAADYARAFAIAREAELGLTCHAGELVGAGSVVDTLDHLKVTRLGHGVRAIENPDVVRRLVDEGIVLEVNPGSNLAIGVYPDLAAHPITKLRDAGVAVTISTDDPPYFHITLSGEYEALARHHGWTQDDFLTANRHAMRAAFCDDETRARALSRLDASYA